MTLFSYFNTAAGISKGEEMRREVKGPKSGTEPEKYDYNDNETFVVVDI